MSDNPLNKSRWSIEADLQIDRALANARRLDAELRKIEEDIRRIVNAQVAPKPVYTFAQAQGYLNAETLQQHPQLQQLVQQHQQRGQDVQAQTMADLLHKGMIPGTAGAYAPGTQAQQAALKAQDTQLKAQDKLAKSYEDAAKKTASLAKAQDDAAHAVREYQEKLRRSSFGYQLQQNLTGSRSLASMGAFATGDMGAMGRTMAYSFASALVNSRPSSIPVLGGVIRRSGALQGIFGGTPGVPGGIGPAVPAEMAGEAGAGAESTLGTAVMSNPISAGIAALLAATVGVVAGANVKQAKDNVQMQNLRAAIGGVGGNADLGETSNAFGQGGIRGGGAQALYNRIYGASHRFFPGQDEKVAFQMAAGMGLQGVTAGQMMGGRGQASAINVALAAARNTGMDPNAAGGYVATLMTKGGQSAQQVADSFRDLGQAADKTGIPMNRLLGSMQALTQASGGTAVNVMSLAATQSIISQQVGAGIDAGQIVSPMMGATGFGAYGMAAMLNMTPGQFTAMQTGTSSGPNKGANVAMGMDKLSQFVKQNLGGMNPMLQAGALQATGMVDLSGMSDEKQQTLMHLLATGQTGQFEKEAAKLIKQGGGGQTWQDRMANVAKQETSFLDQLKNFLEDLKKALGDFAKALTGLTGALDGLKGLLTSLWDFLKNAIAKLFPSATPPPGSQAADAAALLRDQAAAAAAKKQPHDLSGALKGGMDVPTVHGGHAHLSGAEITALQAVSTKTGVPLPLLMATEAHNIKGGVGVMHMQLSGPTAAASERYLNQAAHQLHLHQATSAAQFKKLAQDPHVETLAAGLRLKDLMAGVPGGNWEQVATAYNRGSYGDSPYGQQINAAGGTVNVELHGTIDPDGRVTFPSTTHVVHPRARPGPQTRHPAAVRNPGPTAARNGKSRTHAARSTRPTHNLVDPTATPPAHGSGTHPPAAQPTPTPSHQPAPTATPWAEPMPPLPGTSR